MNYLAVDTSGKNLTIICSQNGKTEVYFDKECGVNHSVKIMPAIEETAKKVGFEFEKADFFAVVVGAGSFTGIRIGVATIKALCLAYKKPCLSVTSFDTIAYNKSSGKNLAIINAKHGSYYVAGYNGNKVDLSPRFISEEELNELKEDYVFLSYESIDGIQTEVVSVKDGLLNAIKEKHGQASTDLEAIVPLYIRKSQAEEGR